MNVKSPYRVHLVLDPVFGRRLADLPVDEPVWNVASPVNEPVVRQLWQQRPTKSRLDSITLFQSHGSPEDAFLGELGTIDLHHGEYSAQPPYSILEVVGCPPSQEVLSALAELGFDVTNRSAAGFSAQRLVPVT